MGNVVSSTADILAILGGVTTLILGVFGAIRLSRCQHVRCCWGCIDLINKPIASAGASPSNSKTVNSAPLSVTTSLGVTAPLGTTAPPTLHFESSRSDSEMTMAVI